MTKMEINQIEKRLQEIIEESGKKLEGSNKSYQKAIKSYQEVIKRINLLIATYKHHLREGLSMDACINWVDTIYCFNNASNMLKTGLEQVHFEDSWPYRERKAVAENLLKNLQNTFGTQERPKEDLTNRLDCINDIDGYFSIPQNINFPYDPQNIYGNFTEEEQELFKERRMSRDTFIKAILRMIENPPICIEDKVIRDETLSRWQTKLPLLLD